MCGLASDQKLRETIIWFAGLLSTDGTIRLRKKRTLNYRIYSSEREWLEQIASKLSDVGIKTSIYCDKARYGWGNYIICGLTMQMPYRVTQLLKKYAKGFMMERKWRRVVSAYPEGFHNLRPKDIGKKYTPWTSEEDRFLAENIGKMPYHEIGKRLGRGGVGNIYNRIQRLKKIGVIPNKH